MTLPRKQLVTSKDPTLLSEEVLFSFMTYVDLNPVRTSLCNTPEASDHTSIRKHIAQSFKLKNS
jgi:hypothetical protein